MTERDRLNQLLRRFGLHATKALGQHFLADEDVLQQIAHAVRPGPDAQVIEVGAGVGNLTYLLALSGAQVLSLELDTKFIPIHREILANRPDLQERVRFVYQDALDFDYAAAQVKAEASNLRFLISGNIPYQITSPLIMKILESAVRFETMTLMMQREVAERLKAPPGSRRFGAISVKVQYYCTLETVVDVPAGAFLPPPEVESQVLQFTPRVPVRAEGAGRPAFFSLVEAAFSQRRKMVANAVAASTLAHSREQVAAALSAIGHSPSVRAEQLGVDDFLALHEKLNN